MEPGQRERDGLLTEQEGRLLVRLAVQALEAHFGQRAAPELDALAGADSRARLEVRRGSFVTLRRRQDGRLRGCTGYIEGRGPLWRDVCALAVHAACRDPRFPPVAAAELEGLAVSVSVLGRPRPIAPEEVVAGRHGVIVRQGARSGLLLPQVATEFGWDAEALLAATCRKAGLHEQAWRQPDCQLFAFEAQVFC
ncbi:MAG: AmmeMemoRadiSam system protein A [Planctomycetota bacterium]|nr:MAG: AmmeMemoRadiSam system protein A [Planctomycetota bacterium]